MNTTIIYTLSDPITNNIRYIGKTTNFKKRFQAHLYRSKFKSNHSECWIYGLKQQKLLPIIEVLDIVSMEDANFWECYYISLFKSFDFDLVNMTEGGDGIKITSVIRDKMSKSRIGKFTGLDNNKSKPVAQLQKGTDVIISVFPSISIAGKSINAPRTAIKGYFEKNRKHGGGYDWKVISKESYIQLKDLYKNGEFKYEMLVQKKPITIYNDTFSEKLDSIYDSCKKLNLQQSLVLKVLKGTREHTKGYKAKYL